MKSWEPMQERGDDTSEDMEQNWTKVRIMRLGEVSQAKEWLVQMP